MRLRVKIKNSKECRTELNFPDLSIKYNNGWAPSLRVAEGAEIPLDVLDPEDIRKSLKVGSLYGYINNGWIEEIPDVEEKPTESPIALSHFITEQMISSPEMIVPLKKSEPIVVTAVEETPPVQPNLPEEVKDTERAKVLVVPAEPITDLTLVKTYEDFERLSHFLKLRFIKDSNDITLLRQIQTLTPSVQFRNNITLRLTQIKM